MNGISPDGGKFKFPQNPIGAEQAIKIMKEYPKTRYATWLYYQYMENPFRWKIKDMLYLIINGRYYESIRSRSFEDNEEACKSIKEESDIILSNYPNFPFTLQLKTQMALCNIVLGDESRGIKELQELLQQEQMKAIKEKDELSDEGKWIEEFLREWFIAKAEGSAQ